jgi:hypothetical protein
MLAGSPIGLEANERRGCSLGAKPAPTPILATGERRRPFGGWAQGPLARRPVTKVAGVLACPSPTRLPDAACAPSRPETPSLALPRLKVSLIDHRIRLLVGRIALP